MKEINNFKSWSEFFQIQKSDNYFLKLINKVDKYYQSDLLFPSKQDLFNSLYSCSLDKLKVVIIGQDPYHNDYQANGLAFSVNPNIPLPPSLKNIFLEIKNEYGYQRVNGDLSDWASQGVLLINTIFTVIKHQPLSCKDWGWEIFSHNLVKYISENKTGIVFVCFGKYALNFIKDIDMNNQYVLSCAHPSPLSAHNGFFNSNIFKKINTILENEHKSLINW